MVNYWPFNSLAVRDNEQQYLVLGFAARDALNQQDICCLECKINDHTIELNPVGDRAKLDWLHGVLYEYIASQDMPLKFGVDFTARDIIYTVDAGILLDKLNSDGVYQVEYSHDNEKWFVYGESRHTGNVDPYLFWKLANVKKFVDEHNENADKQIANNALPYPARYWRYREIIVKPRQKLDNIEMENVNAR